MFSAFKKLTTKPENGNNNKNNSNGGQTSMSSNLQKKFSKGVDYNMKMVIRGDKNTGKTCLLARLQGQPFIEVYNSTEEIQVASINWSYKNTEDVVKVEVWDVVDVAKKRKKLSGLKLADDADEFETGLDASFIDVYKGCHGAILVFDITKPWTFDYVKKEIPNIPSSIPILILANFADASHHRQVTQLQIADFVENIHRDAPDPAEIRWGESSLRNGFGLKFLHKFFNVPFLTLQRQSILQQLEVNTRDILATQQELDMYMETEEASYSQFSNKLTTRRREAAESVAPAPSASIVAGQPSNTVQVNENQFNAPTSEITFSTSQASKPKHSPSPKPQTLSSLKSSPTKVDVDSFIPEDGDFDNFLDETDSARSKPSTAENNNDSSDDDDGGNPMVAKFNDDDSDVEIDIYEPSHNKVRELSEDSDDDKEKVAANCDDALDDFLNGDKNSHLQDYQAM